MSEPVLSIHKWKSNAHLILDVARLGFLNTEWLTLDATWGYGNFWTEWRPERLVGVDKFTPADVKADFTRLPFADRSFDAVVFDPPYQLTGTPTGSYVRYGIKGTMRWQNRLREMVAGAVECARVLGDGYLLVKCQDQVCSQKKRWQTRLIEEALEEKGVGLVDRFDFWGYRYNPSHEHGQQHSASASSQLLVFKRGHDWRPW